MKHILEFEQSVNNRFGTSEPPKIAGALLPESGIKHPMNWLRVSVDATQVITDGSDVAADFAKALRTDREVAIPLHPLEIKNWRGRAICESGSFEVTSSYRTVAYEPADAGETSFTPPDGQTVFFKLYLAEPLPGIPGDRRLTPEKIEKCVRLGASIEQEIASDPLARRLEIVKEFLGVASDKNGFLCRLLPSRKLIPSFSLGSVDLRYPDSCPEVVKLIKRQYGADSRTAASEFGMQFAEPFIESLLAGFGAGFSLEMHAQNTLIEPGADCLISKVYYRDLEGVVVDNHLRGKLGLKPLFEVDRNPEYFDPAVSFERYFNRNYDHDLGRIFLSVLSALESAQYFDDHEVEIATDSIRTTFRNCLSRSRLNGLISRKSQFLPLSRAPWGNGRRLGHYFRTTFR